jgi:hypothetical protein
MTENGKTTPRPDYGGTDAIVMLHPDSGLVMRMDPAKVDDDMLKAAKKAGWTPYDVPKEGFRKNRKRGKGWLQKAIKDGSVADPDAGPPEHQTYPPEAFVVEVPVLRADGDSPPAGG